MSALSVFALYVVTLGPDLSGDVGLFSAVLGAVVFLPGFFIAALAAVATFDRPGLDREMDEPAPVVRLNDGTGWAQVKMTYRMYICYLFAHLTVLSIIIIFISVFGGFVLSEISPINLPVFELIGLELFSTAKNFAEVILLFIYFYILSSLIVLTLHGIYFLMERLHQISADT